MGTKKKFIFTNTFVAIINFKIAARFICPGITSKLKEISTTGFFSYKIRDVLKTGSYCMRINNHTLKIISSCCIFLSTAG